MCHVGEGSNIKLHNITRQIHAITRMHIRTKYRYHSRVVEQYRNKNIQKTTEPEQKKVLSTTKPTKIENDPLLDLVPHLFSNVTDHVAILAPLQLLSEEHTLVGDSVAVLLSP